MKALNFSKKDGLTLILDAPKPEPVDGDALIRVTRAGICGTDIHIVNGYMDSRFEGHLGHEFVGVVEECAASPSLVGKRVCGEINVVCGRCTVCKKGGVVKRNQCENRRVLGILGKDGCLAEFITMPPENLIVIPADLTDPEATFVEPMAAACRITEQLGGQIDDSTRVAVVGDGRLGLLIAYAIRAAGGNVTLLGRHVEKMGIVAGSGIRTAFSADVEKTLPLPYADAYDIVVDATGHPDGLAFSRQLARPQGTIVMKSTCSGDSKLCLAPFIIDETTLLGSRCGPFDTAVELLRDAASMGVDVTRLIEGEYDIADGMKAFEHAKTKGVLKIHVTFGQKESSPAGLKLTPNRWSDSEAESYVATYKADGEDMALRVYTSILIGVDSRLVLHGGGNTSVKTTTKNIVGDEVEVLAVKGSGWDLGAIKPPGLPFVDLAHCRRLRQLERLSDEDMVNEMRSHMLDSKAPNPSVETLLHAFLPHKFVDHSHADAIAAIVDQEDAIEICKNIYGSTFGIVEYIMPGFALAKKAAEVYEQDTSVQGLILLRHGLFTFARTAKESYDNHIAAVNKAEEYIRSKAPVSLTRSPATSSISAHALAIRVLPIIRGAFHKASSAHWVLHSRMTPENIEYASCEEVKTWSQRGPLTPDHVIRTKGWPMLIRGVASLNEEELRARVEELIESYAARYHKYFETHAANAREPKKELDRLPRVILIEGMGVVCAGRTMKDAKISADITEHTIVTIKQAMAIGKYTPVTEKDLFDMEYWSLEQAKLGKATLPALTGRVVYVTGSAGGIGYACAEGFAKKGANVFMTDMDASALALAADRLAKTCKGVHVHACRLDVTKPDAINRSVREAIEVFGGIDVLVSNAGRGFQAPICGCQDKIMRDSFEINFFSHQNVASAVSTVMKQQLSGGALVFNVSKAALNPGPKFGPYAIAKAAALALSKQYALELGSFKITSNAVNADRIRTSFFSEDEVKQRASARGLEPDAYYRSNILGEEVYAGDVADAFVGLATATKTTGTILTVDGGNIAASPR